jgi:hypothetical protein
MLTAFAQWYTIHYANRLQRLPDATLSPLDVLHEMEYGSAHSRESHAVWRSVRVLLCLCPISTVEPCGIACRAMTVLLPAAAGRLPPDDMLTCISHYRSYADLQASSKQLAICAPDIVTRSTEGVLYEPTNVDGPSVERCPSSLFKLTDSGRLRRIAISVLSRHWRARDAVCMHVGALGSGYCLVLS